MCLCWSAVISLRVYEKREGMRQATQEGRQRDTNNCPYYFILSPALGLATCLLACKLS